MASSRSARSRSVSPIALLASCPNVSWASSSELKGIPSAVQHCKSHSSRSTARAAAPIVGSFVTRLRSSIANEVPLVLFDGLDKNSASGETLLLPARHGRPPFRRQGRQRRDKAGRSRGAYLLGPQ